MSPTRFRCYVSLFAVVLAVTSAPDAVAQGGCALQWTPGSINGSIRTLRTLANGDVLAAGQFSSIEGVAANNIARYDGSAWLPLGAGVGAVVATLERPSGDILASDASGLMMWDGSSWQTHPAQTGVAALANLPNGDLAIARSVPGSHPFSIVIEILIWDGSSLQLIGTSSGPATATWTASVAGLGVLPSGELVAVGDWHFMAPQAPSQQAFSYNEAVRWDGSMWERVGDMPRPQTMLITRTGALLVGTWYPTLTCLGGSGCLPGFATVGADIQALYELPNGDVLAGGSLDSLAGPGAAGAGLTRCDASTSSQLFPGYGSTAFGTITALALHRNGRLVVAGAGGSSLGIGLNYADTPCPASAAPLPTGCIGPVGPVSLTASRPAWVGSTFVSRADGFAPNAVGLGVVGLQLQQVPLSMLHPAGTSGCDLLVQDDATTILPVVAGRAGMEIDVPNDPTFVGTVLFHQFVQGAFSGPIPLSLSSSNALRIVVGTF